jgi:hypothetical protein
MEEKIKKIIFIIINSGIIIGAIYEILSHYRIRSCNMLGFGPHCRWDYNIPSIFVYFISAVLLLYLSRYIENKILGPKS